MKRLMMFAILALCCAWAATQQPAPSTSAQQPGTTTKKKNGQSATHQHEAGAPAQGQQPPPAAGMLPKPSEQMQRLTRMFTGMWSTTETHEPSPWTPSGSTGQGREIIRSGPGGLHLLASYRSRNSMGMYEGHGVMSWDPKLNAYKSYWFDVMTPGGAVETCVFEGEALVCKGEMEVPGAGTMQSMGRFTDLTANSFTFTMFMAPKGAEMKKVMTIHYKRITGAVRRDPS